MAPKIVTNPTKLANVLAYFHSSGVAHTLKDLEKALPSIASINGMQVKDYLQALQDENQIRVEKIGSGNWYWSFPSEELKAKEALLEKAQDELEKTNAALREVKVKITEAESSRAEHDDTNGAGRLQLLKRRDVLEKEVMELRAELATHSQNDPVVVEKKIKETRELREQAERWMEQIQEMEKWLKDKAGMDREQLEALKRDIYAGEYDEEEGGLKEY